MDFNFFGWNLKRTKKENDQKTAESFVLPNNDDGAVTVEGVAGAYGAYIDFDATVKNEFELVTRYRELAHLPEVDFAIDDIVNEMIVIDGENDSVQINLSNLKTSATVKKAIEKEFQNILSLLDWNNQAYEIVKKWYVDGRLFHHIIIDKKNNFTITITITIITNNNNFTSSTSTSTTFTATTTATATTLIISIIWFYLHEPPKWF